EVPDPNRQEKLDFVLAELQRRLTQGESNSRISADLIAKNPDLENDILDWIESFESGRIQTVLRQERMTDDYLSSPKPDLSPGDKVGQYTIIRTLSEGEIGVVYVAEEEDTGRHVA